jgi:CheY-like chemotaxis protein
MRVLLVEDIPESRETYRVMLERLGHEVVEAINGKEAVAAAVDRIPDLVLMDLNMPETDGLLGIAALRTISTFGHVPIIAMTAYPQQLTLNRAIDAGCDAYLQKPFSLENLSAALGKFSRPD